MTKRRGGIRPSQPSSNEQSGSAGRKTGTGTSADGKDTGQGRYGQTGLGGSGGGETAGQSRDGQSGDDEAGAGRTAAVRSGVRGSRVRSNRGSGRPDDESENPQKNVDKSKP
jgi:hypothetical protein